jgi:hypothetical protein
MKPFIYNGITFHDLCLKNKTIELANLFIDAFYNIASGGKLLIMDGNKIVYELTTIESLTKFKKQIEEMYEIKIPKNTNAIKKINKITSLKKNKTQKASQLKYKKRF